MENIRKAQRVAAEIKGEFDRRALRGSVKWNEVFDTEVDIVEALKTVDIPERGTQFFKLPVPLYTGYEYIHSFARRVQSGSDLTEAQMKQCKRLAVQIKIAAAVSAC